jgi:hypothetical protein
VSGEAATSATQLGQNGAKLRIASARRLPARCRLRNAVRDVRDLKLAGGVYAAAYCAPRIELAT